MKNRKRIIIICAAVLAAALAAGAVTAFRVLHRKQKITYETGSIEAEAYELIERWFKAIKEGNVEEFTGCCYNDALLEYHMNITGLPHDKFMEYLAYTISMGEFEYRNISIIDKVRLDEDAFNNINSALPGNSRISSEYRINFSYEIMYDDGWQDAEESCNIFIINGICYVDNIPETDR